jgi:predicted ATPase/transcriptional regulator with XRE-family HTH domain
MPSSDSAIPLESFQTFGDLLKYLRRRARLTQRELSIAVGYSEAQVSRLEQNQRPPDLAALTALFIPALYLEDEPLIVARLMELAAQARGEELPQRGIVAFSRSVQREVGETVRSVEEHVQNNLPLQLTSFIGREHEIAHIKSLLDSAHRKVRLITLTGSGGCGKTRLALEIASQLTKLYQDGIWLIELASISNPAHISQVVSAVMDAPKPRDERPTSILIKYLKTKKTLLIFDNCEQVAAAAGVLIEEILRGCLHVQVLATSREILNTPGEVRYSVPPLSLPENESFGVDSLSRWESVRLYVERSQSMLPHFILNEDNFPYVKQICRRLDGMPLAIELAAARMTTLSIQQIAARLEHSFQLLTNGSASLPHHQTLRTTIMWSYDLLPEDERVLLQRLSVFSGGWSLEAAEAVVSDSSLIPSEKVLDLISQLVNKSLVIVEWQLKSDARYSMLQTIHQFARENLVASEGIANLRARHFDYFFTMAQHAEPKLFAAESSINWAETEIDNIRAALSWALEIDKRGVSSQEHSGRALELMLHVWPLWLNRGYSIEGSEWLNRLLAVHTAASPARARALLLAADFVGFRGDASGKATMIQEALTLARALGDKRRTAMALMEMGLVERDQHHYSEAVQFLTESRSMFQELNESLWVYRTSFLLAETYMTNGNLEAAKPLWKKGLDLSRMENDRFHIAWGLEGLGNLERVENHLEQARQLYIESLHLKVSVMDKMGITYSLVAFAQLAAAQKQFKRAAILWGAAEQLGETLNMLLIPSREELYTSMIPDARAELGEESFAEAWAKGRKMKMQEAIDFALILPDN